MLDKLKPPHGAAKKRKRVGRGESSGWGKTAGKGNKGQRARSGGKKGLVGFEGGQMPFQRRLPKRGFTNIFKKEYSILNVGGLAGAFSSGDTVDMAMLVKKGLLKNKRRPVKILGSGDIKIPLTVKADIFSAQAKSKIEAAGGRVETVEVVP
ncbi:MAG: 50S ribosomal protein L15 [Deltaproteobacteria bacterium]|nr:50S ribosomal protein L15 [Deltaproteobacteria bacterium]